MKKPRKIVVEAIIPAPVETVWERTQMPDLHTAWDIRFTHIAYLDETDGRGFNLMDYRTDVAFGIEVQGIGRYLQNTPPHHSTFEFESADWKSIITLGRGIWQYEPCGDGTYFKTVYDYGVRYGVVGRMLDALIFRNLLRLSTEWGFETLRQWCAGDESVLAKRRRRMRFIRYFITRLLGGKPAAGAARSWLGSGQESELKEKAVL
jgi:uncharacterized protein YndB with AHSA1/START domain